MSKKLPDGCILKNSHISLENPDSIPNLTSLGWLQVQPVMFYICILLFCRKLILRDKDMEYN